MLYYLGGASFGLLGAGVCGIFAWNIDSRRRHTPEDGFHEVVLNRIPEPNSSPVSMISEGQYVVRAHIVRNTSGLLALDGRCTVLSAPAFLKWQRDHFTCPACGSQFSLDGSWVAGRAPRDMDRYALEVETPNGLLRTSAAGEPVPIDDATAVYLDEWTLIRGRQRQ